MTEDIRLAALSWEQYLALRDLNYSQVMNRHDPFRPIPTPEQERSWWTRSVESGEHRIRAMVVDERVVGLVHAFSFDKASASCEIGFGIFREQDHGKGIASAAIRLWMQALRDQDEVRVFTAETTQTNAGALKVLAKVGFRPTDSYVDDGIGWVVLEFTNGTRS